VNTCIQLKAVMNFIAPYRSAIGGCVAGQGDVMIGCRSTYGTRKWPIGKDIQR